MKEVAVLKNNTTMPIVGLGTWQLNGAACVKTVKAALALGYRHIDTAEVYFNHREVGKAIKESGVDREELFITSKIWHGNLHYKDVLAACDRILKDLGLTYVDLLLIHWPNRKIPFKETFDALKKCLDEQKTKMIGVSNFTQGHLRDAFACTNVPIVVNQIECHPFLHQKELREFCKAHDIQVVAYSPLARGEVFKNDVIRTIAKKYNKTPGQISLRWLVQEGCVVIPKASSEKHLKENMEIFDFELSNEDMREIASLPQKRLIAPLFIADFDYR